MLVVVDRIATLVPLGPQPQIETAMRRLVADLDVLAGRLLPKRMTTAAGAVAARDAATLSRLVIEPLARWPVTATWRWSGGRSPRVGMISAMVLAARWPASSTQAA